MHKAWYWLNFCSVRETNKITNEWIYFVQTNEFFFTADQLQLVVLLNRLHVLVTRTTDKEDTYTSYEMDLVIRSQSYNGNSNWMS